MDKNEELLKRLEGALNGDGVELSGAEVIRLRQMIAAYEMFLAGGKLGKWFIVFVLGLASVIAASIKLAEYFGAAVRASGKSG